MLNRYYDAAEIVLKQHQAIKTRWLADEVLAVFASADEAVAAASELRAAMGTLFSDLEIGVGIGLNTGLVVEGLMGSHTMQAYDVIGDTVNTAKRIEGGAAAGEVLLAETTWQKLTPGYAVSLARQIAAKGKALPVTVYPLAGAL
jgi:class 3 adenylate cyclase